MYSNNKGNVEIVRIAAQDHIILLHNIWHLGPFLMLLLLLTIHLFLFSIACFHRFETWCLIEVNHLTQPTGPITIGSDLWVYMVGPQTIHSLNAHSTHTHILGVTSLVRLWLKECCRSCWKNYVLQNVSEYGPNSHIPMQPLNSSMRLNRAVTRTHLGLGESHQSRTSCYIQM
jgi:hypothetical protein